MLKPAHSQLLLILVGICNMLFATDVQATLLGANARTKDIEIELSTGKNTYIKGEPIYFDILATNYSNSIVKMNEPLSIGWGGYTFKNLSTGVSVGDIVIWGGWHGMQPFILGMSARRNIGTINQRDINLLLPKTNKRYLITVAKHFIINDEGVTVESNPVEITVLPKSKIDSKLIAELSKLGSLSPLDNSESTRLFGGRNIPSARVSDSALTILRKYNTSVYFPYFVSYISRYHTPGLDPNFKGKNDDFLLDFLNNSERELAGSDKYLSIMHMSRLASRYLSRTAHDGREHRLRNIGLKYKEHLSNQFAGESNERHGRRKNIDVQFYMVDRVIAPEKINRIGERRTPRTEAEN